MNCIVIDDEPMAHQVLEHYIDQTPGLRHLASFRNAIEAFEYLGQHQVDLLFLDIEMPLINGLHFLKALTTRPKTIFTTAYKQYAFESYELEAVDYLLKPFSYERFTKAVSKAGLWSGPAEDDQINHLLIKDGQSLLKLKQQDIIYVEGCKDYVKVFTKDKFYLVYQTLKGILEQLSSAYFVQAHRSYIVNKNYVERIVENKLIIGDQSFIPIGPLYKKDLLEAMKR
ncbi:LytR/AlgR family response regulator transcription factor [Pedobacter nutrimenti]|jgi:DNA-binding LytR/AlgR family response regulator|uniref:LytTR family two component transcriptional regulator n=1 Tax=Pedobacter nutrimenti TaxID=1241337 RepID=A0A318UID6_9SPHI|nr:LytTR family DNA-binding domain-containing protein [Pedobacter nutrimenti]PYF74808.1 LytTR family two component transcriptional regulator [Pedobacter nutrimenti]